MRGILSAFLTFANQTVVMPGAPTFIKAVYGPMPGMQTDKEEP